MEKILGRDFLHSIDAKAALLSDQSVAVEVFVGWDKPVGIDQNSNFLRVVANDFEGVGGGTRLCVGDRCLAFAKVLQGLLLAPGDTEVGVGVLEISSGQLLKVASDHFSRTFDFRVKLTQEASLEQITFFLFEVPDGPLAPAFRLVKAGFLEFAFAPDEDQQTTGIHQVDRAPAGTALGEVQDARSFAKGR